MHDAPVESDGGPVEAGADARRQRYGRRRGGGPLPAGEWFVGRLGPAGNEPFAAVDDEDDAPPPRRADPSTPIDEVRFVAVDCETTGQTPHRLVELGAVAFTTRGHIASFETLVHCTDRINPYARRIHGITPELLAGSPPPALVMRRFLRFAAGAVLVEHSADAFDTRLLGRTHGEPLDNDHLDTSKLASHLWRLRDTIGLERLCAELGITVRGAHTALGDAEATAAAFLELVRRGRLSQGWTTLGDLLGDGQPPPPRPPLAPGMRRRTRGGVVVTTPATEAAAEAPAGDEASAAEVGGEDAGEDGAPRRRRRRGGRRRRRTGEGGEAVAGEAGAATEAGEEA